MMRKIVLTVALLLAALALTGQSVTVVSPNGGESMTLGQAWPIAWTATNLSQNVKIQLIRPGGGIAGVIASGLAPGSSPYSWIVGQTGSGTADPGDYKIRVLTADASTQDASDQAFTIAGAPGPSLRILAPNGGEAWPFMSKLPITWDYALMPAATEVKLSLYRNNAFLGVLFPSLPAGQGSVLWPVGGAWGIEALAPPGDGYKVRIEALDQSVFDLSDNPFTIAPALKTIKKELAPILARPRLEVTAIDLVPDSNGFRIIFGFKNAGNAAVPPASSLPVLPDYRVLIDDREIAKGDLRIPEFSMGPGWEIKENPGGLIPFPAPGDPRPWTIGDKITIILNERNVLGNVLGIGSGTTSKTGALRLIALHNFYDLALIPVTYDWSEGVAHLLVTKVGGSVPRSKKFVLHYTIRGYHPSGTVPHDWNEAVVDVAPGPFVRSESKVILSTDSFPVHIDLPLSPTFSTFYELGFVIRPEFRDEFDERNNSLPKVRFDRPD